MSNEVELAEKVLASPLMKFALFQNTIEARLARTVVSMSKLVPRFIEQLGLEGARVGELERDLERAKLRCGDLKRQLDAVMGSYENGRTERAEIVQALDGDDKESMWWLPNRVRDCRKERDEALAQKEKKCQTITREQFAKWSFERDRSVGLFTCELMLWENLSQDERDDYLDEADYYINEHPRDDWPVDILERL